MTAATDNMLFFNWSEVDPIPELPTDVDYLVFDETLRDGIQAPYVIAPPLEVKLRLVDHMVNVGVGAADLGFPGASARAKAECMALAEYIVGQGHPIRQAYAGRTHPEDIGAICDIAQTVQCDVDAYGFIGVSPVRQYAESWSLALIQTRLVDTARQCRAAGVNFVLVLEDSTRCTPEILSEVFDIAHGLGVTRITLCDTVGAATPASTQALVRWSLEHFRALGHDVALDWHGHNDRGLALANSLTAIEAGCDRIHATALGIGERAGNTALDQLILNRHLEHGDAYDLLALRRYCEDVSTALHTPIAVNYPALGARVFCTSAGVHAAAILKARQRGDRGLLDSIYSSVPASALGRCQEVLVDAASGASNVEFWLLERGYEPSQTTIDRVLAVAKSSNRPLTAEEIEELVDTLD
jgi:2-isopropylmalate synthase